MKEVWDGDMTVAGRWAMMADIILFEDSSR
jgi:hypothetical protein